MERKGEIQRGPQQQHLGVPMGKAGTRASAASKQKQHAGSVQVGVYERERKRDESVRERVLEMRGYDSRDGGRVRCLCL